jgi:hypothetical protein
MAVQPFFDEWLRWALLSALHHQEKCSRQNCRLFCPVARVAPGGTRVCVPVPASSGYLTNSRAREKLSLEKTPRVMSSVSGRGFSRANMGATSFGLYRLRENP